ncbi:MAG: ABC transporter permease [Acidobacteria bacterium]|nr:ABC transporter permease [Acidobacteriota bacterium]
MRRWSYLVIELTAREMSVRFSGSIGGLAWGLLTPLFQCAIFGVVFGLILRVPPPPDLPGGYPMFLLSGWLPWMAISESILSGSASVVQNSHLVKKMQFPAETLVISRILATLALEGAALLSLTLIAGLGYGIRPRPSYAVVAFLLQVLLLTGPVRARAAIAVFFRDVTQVLPSLLMAVLYLTPVLYPENQVPARLQPILAFSPFRDLLALFRAAFAGGVPPPAGRLALQAALFLLVAVAGLWFFRRSRPDFADLI